jgi:hypothetical protein
VPRYRTEVLSPAGSISNRYVILVSLAGLPLFFGVRWPSVTNSNTDGLVASVTTERSENDPIGSMPVLRNSVPTPAGPSGASRLLSPKFSFPCIVPAQVVWVVRSASTA